jgi:C-terminal processing protease CtpA/Prc
MKNLLLLSILFSLIAGMTAMKPNQWVEDIDYLSKQLPKLHKNAYHTITKEEFRASIKALKQKASLLTDDEMVIELTRFVASIGDAHTSLWQTKDFNLKTVPIKLRMFDDGLYVLAIDSNYQSHLKQKVLSINNIPTDSVCRMLSVLVPHENIYWLNDQLPNVLATPQAHKYFGFSNQPDSILFRFDDGRSLTLGIPTKPVKYSRVTPAERNLLMVAPHKNYWMRKGDKRIYIQYNRCRIDTAYTFQKFTDDVMAAFDDSTTKVIVDLRLNVGGNSSQIDPLVKRLKERKKQQDFKTYVCIGPKTFSSGTFAAVDLQRELGAVLIGEPTGGSPYSYGNVKALTLPNSKLMVGCSTNFYNINNSKLNTIYPDVEIVTTASRYFRGVDAVVSYAFRD